MDKQNFTSLFLKIRDRLRDISIRFLEDDDEVNDALQDMFLKLWSRSDRFQDEKHATGVMVTAIKNLSIDALRHSASHNTEHVDAFPDVPADDIDSNSTIDDINHAIEQLNYYNDLIKSNTERLNELKENKEQTKKIKIDNMNDYYAYSNKYRSIPIIFYD